MVEYSTWQEEIAQLFLSIELAYIIAKLQKLFYLKTISGDFLRRALNGEAKNGLLKHSNSYPVLDENIVKDASPPAATSATAPSATESPSSESASPRPQQLNDSLVDDTMLMDEDYMYDTVNVSKGERGVGKKVDVDKLKQTLIGLKSKRHRQQVRPFILMRQNINDLDRKIIILKMVTLLGPFVSSILN